MSQWNIPQVPIFVKLVLAFLLVIIPLYTISLLLNNWGAASVREEISNSMKSRVHFYIRSLVEEFDRIQRLQREFINDDDLRKLSVASQIMSDLERTHAIIRLQSRLGLVKNSSNYIASANAYIPEINKVINSQSVYDIPQMDLIEALVDQTEMMTPVAVWNDRLFITQKYPDVGYPDTLTFFLSLELSMKQVQRELAEFIHFDDEQAILISDDFNWSIASAANSELSEQLKNIVNTKVQGNTGTSLDVFMMNNQKYIMTMEHSSLFHITLLMYMPEKSALGPLKKYNAWFRLLSLSSFLIVVVFSFWIYRVIHRPMKRLVRSFRKVEKGNLNVKLEPNSNDEFQYLYSQFNAMMNQLRILIGEVYEEKIRSQKSELKQLQAQINPHFLYNTFFILNRMVKMEDYPKLAPFTKNLGHYFKFITRDASDEVPLREELEFTKSYLEIQKIRFEERIRITLDPLPDEFATIKVPRLTLQPIIENCYKYGLEDIERDGHLSLRFEQADKLLIITIEDNGNGMSDEELWRLNRRLSNPPELMESTGIINVHKRLQLKYGHESGIVVSTSGELGGLKVSLFIPLREE